MDVILCIMLFMLLLGLFLFLIVAAISFLEDTRLWDIIEERLRERRNQQ